MGEVGVAADEAAADALTTLTSYHQQVWLRHRRQHRPLVWCQWSTRRVGAVGERVVSGSESRDDVGVGGLCVCLSSARIRHRLTTRDSQTPPMTLTAVLLIVVCSCLSSHDFDDPKS